MIKKLPCRIDIRQGVDNLFRAWVGIDPNKLGFDVDKDATFITFIQTVIAKAISKRKCLKDAKKIVRARGFNNE